MLTISRDACQTLRLQSGNWMLFIDSRNSSKVAVVYTVHTRSIRIFNCVTRKNYWKWWADAFLASQINCTPLDRQMSASKHQTGVSSIFSIGSWSAGLGPATSPAYPTLDIFANCSEIDPVYAKCLKTSLKRVYHKMPTASFIIVCKPDYDSSTMTGNM